MRRSRLISDRAWRILTKRDAPRFDRLLALDYGRTLDVGCGQGYFTTLLALKGIDVTAVDNTESRLEAARDLARINGAHVTFIHADARSLPFDDFDTVVCLETLEHITDWQAALGECARIARSNLYITVPAKGAMTRNKGHVNDFDPEEIAERLDGFTVTTDVEWPFSYIIARRERHADAVHE